MAAAPASGRVGVASVRRRSPRASGGPSQRRRPPLLRRKPERGPRAGAGRLAALADRLLLSGSSGGQEGLREPRRRPRPAATVTTTAAAARPSGLPTPRLRVEARLTRGSKDAGAEQGSRALRGPAGASGGSVWC